MRVAEGRGNRLQSRFDFLPLGFRVRGVLDLALVGDGRAAFDVHGTAMRGGPAVAPVEAGAALVQSAGDAVELAQHDADVRGAAARERGDDARPGADDAEFLLRLADRKARFVGEVHQRQVERVAEFDQADGLLASRDVH